MDSKHSEFGRNDADMVRDICAELRANASDLIDGDCDEELVARLTAHMAECEECDSWTDSLRSTVELLKELPPSEPSAELLAKIRAIASREA